MGLTYEQVSLEDVAAEDSNRFDQKVFVAERKFESFSANFDEVVKLGVFLEGIRNGQDVKTDFYSDVETDLLYVSVNQISGGILGEMYWDDVTYLDLPEDDINVEAKEGDVLVARSGSYPGIACAIRGEHLGNGRTIVPAGFTQRLRLRDDAPLTADFLAAYLNSPPVKMLTQAYACGKEQLNISQAYLRQIPVPVLDQDERDRVIQFSQTCSEKMQQVMDLFKEIEKGRGKEVVSLLTDPESTGETSLPEVPSFSVGGPADSDGSWSLPTRRGGREETFYARTEI